MNKYLITEDLIDRALNLLDTKTPFKKEMIYYEIQDDGECLFMSVPIDEFLETEPASTFKNAGLLLEGIMPSRSNDYSWMITFTKKGKVVIGHFGGNLASPNSGL